MSYLLTGPCFAAGWDFICLISFDDEQAETKCFCGDDCVYF